MNHNIEFIINQEIDFSNKLSLKYHYPDNITHLLYLIIPAFILKYGLNHQQLIEKCFSEVPIIIDDKQDQIYQAYYISNPSYQNDKVITTKGIILKNYQNISLMQLLDNLVHEFNHAINSIQNEIKITDYILIRTGITYNYFNKKDLKFLKKSDEITLEEVINTKQTEMVIDIIRSFASLKLTNTVVENTLYSIYHSIDSNYQSNSYLIESIVCHKLLENKTFLSTLESLRFKGQIKDIHIFFDSIIGKEGSLIELSKLLNKSLELQIELNNIKWFKKSKLKQIKKITDKSLIIVEKFNHNTIYK